MFGLCDEFKFQWESKVFFMVIAKIGYKEGKPAGQNGSGNGRGHKCGFAKAS